MQTEVQTEVTARTLGSSILERIGNTPLLRLDRLTAHLPGITLLGKAEWANPGGSVKDRAASSIVAAAEAQGLLAGRHLLDATSGNTGIAYAMLGAAKGFPVTLCMPSNVSPERKRILAAYGANSSGPIPRTGPMARSARRGNWRRIRTGIIYADQYGNEANWNAHYKGTANEIWQQTEGQITHFVAGLGTSGTFMGTTRRLKELNPAIECIAMQPDSPFHGLEGLKYMATAIVPPIYDAGAGRPSRGAVDRGSLRDGQASGPDRRFAGGHLGRGGGSGKPAGLGKKKPPQAEAQSLLPFCATRQTST